MTSVTLVVSIVTAAAVGFVAAGETTTILPAGPAWDSAAIQVGALGILSVLLTWLLRYYIPRRDAEFDTQRAAADLRFQASIKELTDRHERVLNLVAAEFSDTRKTFEDTLEKYREEKHEQLAKASEQLLQKEQQLIEILQRRVNQGGAHASQ